MNHEWLMIGAMGAGGILFACGGTGPKWMRRFLLPAILGLLAFFGGFGWQQSAAMSACLVVAFCLPYGERTPYWLKLFVFMTYPASTLWLGFTWWQPISVIICFGCFCLSNWKPTSQTFLWKICEFIMGSSVGIIVASLIFLKSS